MTSMVHEDTLQKEWYKPGEIAKMIGVAPRTILNYNEKGVIHMRLDEETNRWYLSRDNLIQLLDKRDLLIRHNPVRKVAIYSRVSSHDQKKHGDLQRQVEYLEDYCKRLGIYDYRIFEDVGSGLNTKRSGLSKMIDTICNGEISMVYITYRDRMTRFGFEYLERFFKHCGVEIIVVCDREEKSMQDELVQDIMSLLASFSGRLYGMRSGSKKRIKEVVDCIEEEV